MPQINLLPWRQLQRARRQKEFGIAALGALLAAAAVTLFTSWGFSAAIDRQHERNELLKRETAQLDKQITEILGLEAQKQRMRSRMDIVERLQRSRPEVVHVFDQLARTLPDGVYLTSIKQTDKKLELKGIAQSSTRVSTFMRNIEASPWLTDPQLQVVETLKTGKVGADFTLTAMQKSTVPDDEIKSGKHGPVRTAALGAGGH
jgi:type IV pilus assembly protein PilN